MEQKVIITIQGVQTFEDSEPETTELTTAGMLADFGGGEFALSYQESELTGLEGTLTTFQVEPDCITLLRAGVINSQMVFQLGRRHLSMYETPYGALSVGVQTRKMKSSLGALGGDIDIAYAIEIDHAMAGENVFHINVRTPEPPRIKQ